METENFEYFTHHVLPLVILIVGLFGNSIGLKVLLHNTINSMILKRMYCFLLFFDLIYLTNLLVNYLEASYELTITITSSITCKIHNYFSNTFASISPMILAYISFERFIETKSPNLSEKLRSRKFQFAYLAVILIFNLIFYLPVPILSIIYMFYFNSTIYKN
jgi:hypothetical protein